MARTVAALVNGVNGAEHPDARYRRNLGMAITKHIGGRCCVIGAGGIGRALAEAAAEAWGSERIWLLHREGPASAVPNATGITELAIDVTDAASIQRAAAGVGAGLARVIVATGTLHGPDHRPEKTLRQIDPVAMRAVFEVNTVGPAMVGRYFIPLLAKDRPGVFAALSARVGSISDNRLGGWYSYRASKAALNMLIKTFAVETRRSHPDAAIVGLHPGTVATGLSAPFQRNVPEGKLFEPRHAAEQLLSVLDRLQPSDSGHVFDWAGERVPE
ncbi:MAG: SDR family NAD(P)-dependent oxidoreductase [Pseudomonadota bacterium]